MLKKTFVILLIKQTLYKQFKSRTGIIIYNLLTEPGITPSFTFEHTGYDGRGQGAADDTLTFVDFYLAYN